MGSSTNFIVPFLLFMLVVMVAYLVYEWVRSEKRKSLAAPHLKLLSDSKPSVRAAAAKALGEIRHAPSASRLVEALSDGDISVREAAAGALGKLGHQDSLGSLVHTALHDDIPSVRGTAAKALQAIAKKYTEYIDDTRWLNSINATQRANQLQDLIDTYITPGLMLALKDEDASVREISAAALHRLGESKALETSGEKDSQPDEVQFSAFYPPTVTPEVQEALFIYAHLQGKVIEVENDLKRLGEWVGEKVFKSKSTKQVTQLREGTRVTVVPESDEIKFSPASITRVWKGNSVRFKFRFKPTEGLSDESISVRTSIRVEGVEIAQIKFSMDIQNERTHPTVLGQRIENPLAKAKHNSQTAGIYQKIFVSYSRHNKEVVEAYRFAQLAVGNDVFMDTYSIRSGEDWRAALAKAIDAADVFQLFWSKDSAASSNVQDEWDYALKYKCPQTRCVDFIRPVYWVNPIPAPPPDELNRLNFKYIPLKERFKHGS